MTLLLLALTIKDNRMTSLISWAVYDSIWSRSRDVITAVRIFQLTTAQMCVTMPVCYNHIHPILEAKLNIQNVQLKTYMIQMRNMNNISTVYSRKLAHVPIHDCMRQNNTIYHYILISIHRRSPLNNLLTTLHFI